MKKIFTGRRDFLKQAGVMGSMAMMAGMPEGAMALGGAHGGVVEEVTLPAQAEEVPKNHIKFAVCGMSHDHIYGMIGAVQREGRTLIPLKLYFNEKGIAKLELALATGKKAHDKRATIKERDWQRQSRGSRQPPISMGTP